MFNSRRFLEQAREALVPPAFSAWAARRSKYHTKFTEVATWDQAVRESTGYNDSAILDRIDSATRSVIAGEALFERDGFLFNEPEYRWPVVTALLQAYSRDGYLRVVDLGGALGSVYWQHRRLLPKSGVTWSVVEQPSFVERGQNLPTSEITFRSDLAPSIASVKPNVVVLSSVLQYLKDPLQVIFEVLESSPADLVIDRTPLHAGDRNIPTVQQVPSHIYSGSYPAWIISRPELSNRLTPHASVTWFSGIEPDGRTNQGTTFQWQGLLALRNSH